jgi:hypothetical protein
VFPLGKQKPGNGLEKTRELLRLAEQWRFFEMFLNRKINISKMTNYKDVMVLIFGGRR